MTEGLYKGDCLDMMRAMEPESVDAIVTDPPYGLNFMSKNWDHGVPGVEFWREALRVAKPGAHLLAFGGTRTYHRLACAIEDAGWEVRDCLQWVYATGFPKSLDVSKALDAEAGAEREVVPGRHEASASCVNVAGNDGRCVTCGKWRGSKQGNCQCERRGRPVTDLAREWAGWGTALKPSYEPIIVARKPLCGTVAKNVREHGTGALHIDACRVGTHVTTTFRPEARDEGKVYGAYAGGPATENTPGRYPANLLLQHAPGCRKVGVRKVQGTHGVRCQRGDATATSFAMGGSGEEVGYADADGMETVAVWECVPGCPVAALDEMSGVSKSTDAADLSPSSDGRFGVGAANPPHYRKAKRVGGFADTGGASRFFTCFEPEVPFLYCPKASRAERNAGLRGMGEGMPPWGNVHAGTGKPVVTYDGRESTRGVAGPRQNVHPTVKPIAVIEWLLKLATREGALVLDPFLGSGTTAVACIRLGRRWAGAEITPEYWPIIEARVAHAERTRQPELFGGEVC